MIFFVNRFVPFKGFEALAIWPIMFIRKGSEIDEKDIRHEKIHGRQQCEMLWVLFFLWYGIEWLVRLLLYWNKKEAYYNISFEQEAYINQIHKNYLQERKWYAWTKYLTKKYFVFNVKN